MKKILNRGSLAFAFLVVFYFLCIGCKPKNNGVEQNDVENHDIGNHVNASKDKIYTCSMHPEIIRTAPGNCPICNMKLVEKKITPSNNKLSLGGVLAPVNETVISNIAYTTAKNKIVENEIEVTGYITYNPKNTSSISSRFAGRIEKLYVKYNFQEVKKGQKLMEIYSPEMLAAQQNYLLLFANKEEDTELLNGAKQKLQLLGMSSKQIQKNTRFKKADLLVAIYATSSGHVHQMESQLELTMPVMPSADGSGMNDQSNFPLLKEGTYIEKGTLLFNIISLSDMWAILKINAKYETSVKEGMPVIFSSEIDPQKKIQATIDYIEPLLEKDSKFISARVYLKKLDHHVFKVGSLIKGNIQMPGIKGLWIPATAVLNLGNDKTIVFRKNGSHYYTKNVIVGNRSGNEVHIVDGLNNNDSIATNAGYLIDSESFITVK